MSSTSRGRVFWYSIGSIVTVVFLTFGLLQVVAVLARSSVPIDVDRSSDGVQQVVVEVPSGSVDIRGTDSTRIRVTGEVRSGLATTEHSERLEGADYVVQARCPNVVLANFCEAHLVIEVPRSLAVRVDSANTGVTVSDLEGPVHVRTSNSAVRAERLTSTEPVVLTSSNGSVRARGLRTPELDARSSNAEVSVSFFEPPRDVSVRSSNGSALVVVPDTSDSYAVQIDTSNGEQRTDVRTDPSSSRRITVDTSNANAVVRYPEG